MLSAEWFSDSRKGWMEIRFQISGDRWRLSTFLVRFIPSSSVSQPPLTDSNVHVSIHKFIWRTAHHSSYSRRLTLPEPVIQHCLVCQDPWCPRRVHRDRWVRRGVQSRPAIVMLLPHVGLALALFLLASTALLSVLKLPYWTRRPSSAIHRSCMQAWRTLVLLLSWCVAFLCRNSIPPHPRLPHQSHHRLELKTLCAVVDVQLLHLVHKVSAFGLEHCHGAHSRRVAPSFCTRTQHLKL